MKTALKLLYYYLPIYREYVIKFKGWYNLVVHEPTLPDKPQAKLKEERVRRSN